MPPEKKPRPSARAKADAGDTGSSSDVFGIDPQNPDPGRVTMRRLNRVEYRNTIRDLMGVDFKAEEEFPPDDTGYGFDNIGDVLTRLAAAAGEIHAGGGDDRRRGACRAWSRVVRGEDASPAAAFRKAGRQRQWRPVSLSTTRRSSAAAVQGGHTRAAIVWSSNWRSLGQFDFDPGRVPRDVQGRRPGAAATRNSAGRTARSFSFEFDENWEAGRAPARRSSCSR